MKILFSEQRLCTCCMKEHKIDTVEIKEKITFKGISVNYNAVYEYCSYTDELSETEAMIRANGLSVKDAYRKEVGLLTSNEIKSIREKYKVSQKSFPKYLIGEWRQLPDMKIIKFRIEHMMIFKKNQFRP